MGEGGQALRLQCQGRRRHKLFSLASGRLLSEYIVFLLDIYIHNVIDIKIEEPYCHSVAGSGAHQGRVQDAGDHAAAQAEPDCESLNLAIILFYLFLHSYFNMWNGCLYTLLYQCDGRSIF